MSNLVSCSSASERVKFGEGPKSPCMLKKITLLIFEASGLTITTVHCIAAWSFSSLAGMDKVDKDIPPPISIGTVVVTPLDIMSALVASAPSTVQLMVALFPVQLNSMSEFGLSAAL